MKNSKQKLISIISGTILVYLVSFSFANAAFITKEEVIQLTNKDRVERKVGILTESTTLSQAAIDKANDMIKNNYFAHTSPQGISPWYWFQKNDYDYQYAGENLAIGFSNSNEEESAWMKSPTHRKNILNPKYKEIGVAVVEGKVNDADTTVVVQLFGTRVEAAMTKIKKEPSTLAVENQYVPEVKTENRKIYSIDPNYRNNNLEKSIKDKSALAKMDEFIRTVDIQKLGVIIAVVVLAVCLVLNFMAILFVSIKSVSGTILEKSEAKN